MSTIRTVDTSEGYELSVSDADLSNEDQGVTLAAYTVNGDPDFIASLTANEARMLANHLLEMAEDADLANLARTDA